jgi:hypothetical protein
MSYWLVTSVSDSVGSINWCATGVEIPKSYVAGLISAGDLGTQIALGGRRPILRASWLFGSAIVQLSL